MNLLAGAKTQSNPESCVGILSLAGKVPKMLVTPTPDLGKVLNSMHGMQPEGHTNVTTGVQARVRRQSERVMSGAPDSRPAAPCGRQVAMLALKHRANKNQRQRVVIFCGSPLEVEEESLVKLGKKLKKNNVALDVVAFANTELNEPKLAAFVAAANASGNSNLVVVPQSGLALADVLISSAVFSADGEATGSGFAAAAAAGAAAAVRQVGGGAGFEFEGVDPTLDPELALALRVSMEEERARQEAQARAASEAGGPPGAAAPPPAGADDVMQLDEDALLQQALAMSMGSEGGGEPAPGAAAQPGALGGGDEFAEDPELALALQMSVAEAQEASQKPKEGQ